MINMFFIHILNHCLEFSFASLFSGEYFIGAQKGVSAMGNDTTQVRRLSAVMFTDMVGYSALTQAKSKLHKAIELDPLSAVVRTDLGQVYYHEGNYKQAIKEYQKSLVLDSSYVYTYAYLGQTYAMHNMLTKAEDAFQYAVQVTAKKDPATLVGLAHVYTKQNKSTLAMSIITRLENFGDDFLTSGTYVGFLKGRCAI
jgi:tetratricopeptide (TPR) repeat protein